MYNSESSQGVNNIRENFSKKKEKSYTCSVFFRLHISSLSPSGKKAVKRLLQDSVLFSLFCFYTNYKRTQMLEKFKNLNYLKTQSFFFFHIELLPDNSLCFCNKTKSGKLSKTYDDFFHIFCYFCSPSKIFFIILCYLKFLLYFLLKRI